MEPIFDEEMIRAELRRLDIKTGLHAADLPIKFGNAKCTLGRFSYPSKDKLEFYFSNFYFQDPMHPVEEKLDTIRHEYAHYMDYMLNGSSSHGPSWKKCCRIIGAFPTRCFSKQRSDTYLKMHERERLQNEKYDKYVSGRKVIHPMFGEGIIVDIIGDGVSRIVTVSFGGIGIKKIAVSWIDSHCQRI